jgi:type IV secretory pathway TrbD component
VGGTSLVLVGLYEAVLSIVVLADLLGGGEGLVSLILLVPLAFGIGIVACGLGMIRRGWANAEPDVPEVGDRQPRQVRRPVPDSEVGSAASGWLTALAGIALWITAPVGLALWVTGSILMLLAGVPFTLAMLLGWLLPAAVHLVSRLWSSRRPDV